MLRRKTIFQANPLSSQQLAELVKANQLMSQGKPLQAISFPLRWLQAGEGRGSARRPGANEASLAVVEGYGPVIDPEPEEGKTTFGRIGKTPFESEAGFIGEEAGEVIAFLQSLFQGLEGRLDLV